MALIIIVCFQNYQHENITQEWQHVQKNKTKNYHRLSQNKNKFTREYALTDINSMRDTLKNHS